MIKLNQLKCKLFRTKRLDEMMKYICAHEVISTHYEVKKFLSLEKLRNRNDFDPAQDPEIESGSSGSATQGAGQWSSWKNSNMSPSDFNYIMKIGKELASQIVPRRTIRNPESGLEIDLPFICL